MYEQHNFKLLKGEAMRNFLFLLMVMTAIFLVEDGNSLYGATGTFNTKSENVTDNSGTEVFQDVLLARGGNGRRPPRGKGGPGGPDFDSGVKYLATIGITVTPEELKKIVAGPPAPTPKELVVNFSNFNSSMVITEAQAQALLDALALPKRRKKQ